MVKQTQIIIRKPLVDHVFTFWPDCRDGVLYHMSDPLYGRLLSCPDPLSAKKAVYMISDYLPKYEAIF